MKKNGFQPSIPLPAQMAGSPGHNITPNVISNLNILYLLIDSCEGGYTGSRCDVSPCLSEDCNGQGTCVVSAQKTASCQCQTGYGGDKCQTASSCPPNHCGRHSYGCSVVNGQATCSCFAG